MKAILISEFGTEDVLYEADIPVPAIAEDEILIKVCSISVNHIDLVVRSGMMQSQGIHFPHLLGQDFSGIVEDSGSKVSKFKVGDKVAGINMLGTYAEFISIKENAVVKVQDTVNINHVGALPVVGVTAWSAIINNGKLEPNQSVLIHGGAGGVGHIAIQLAKNIGAYVITTASNSNKDFLHSLGADEVIDYTTIDFSKAIDNLDLVIDTVGKNNQADSMSVLKSGGKFISIASPPDNETAQKYGVEAEFVRGDLRPETLLRLIDYYDKGIIKLQIAETYPFGLEQMKKAHVDLAVRHTRGKRLIYMK